MSRQKGFTVVMAVVLFISGLFAFAGCGSATPATTAPATSASANTAPAEPVDTTPKEKVKITYWHIFPDGDAFKPVHDELIKKFNESQNEVEVEDLGISFFDYLTKLQTAIPAGTTPDVGFNGLGDSNSRASSGVLVGLDEYIAKYTLDMTQYYASLLTAVTYDGKVYGLPMCGGGHILVYNKQMFRDAGLDPEKPPKTLSELEAYSDKLTQFNDDGSIKVLGFHPSLGNAQYRDYLLARGGDFFDADKKPVVNSAVDVETLTWYVHMSNKYGTKQTQELQAGLKTTGIDPFLTGKVAMEVNVDDFYKKLKDSDIDYGVCQVPIPDKDGQYGTWFSGFDLEVFQHNDDARAEAAFKFISFMTNVESATTWVEKNVWPVGNQRAMESSEVLKNDPVWQVIIADLKEGKPDRYITECPGWWGFIYPEIEAAQLNQKTPQQALDDAQKAVESDIENYKATH